MKEQGPDIARLYKNLYDSNLDIYRHKQNVLEYHQYCCLIFVEKNNMDLGINIADDLEELKNNLNKFKNSKERTSL